MRYLPAALVTVVALTLAPASHADATAKKIKCEKDLKEALGLIENMWSFKIFKPGAVDLSAAFRELYPLAKGAETPEECAKVLARFMAKLGDGHSRLQYFPDLDYTTPLIVVRSQRERLSKIPGQRPKVHAYVVARDTTDEALKTIPRGSEILSVDGVPTDSLYRTLEPYVSGSTQQWKDYMLDEQFLMGPEGSELELTYREPGGARKTITITRPLADSLEDLPDEIRAQLGWKEETYSKRLDDGWAYLRYTSFARGSLKRTVKLFDEALDSVFDAPGLIIDLRGNGGGYVDAITKIIGRFITERTTVGYYNVRTPGQATIMPVWDDVSGGFTSKPRLLAKPRGDVYTGPVVILIDRRCFSACESFTGGMQGLGRALVIGPEATGGGSGFVGGLKLPSGAIISFSWTVAWLLDGKQIEGNGVSPDIRVRERPRDWAAGRDRVLERAIKALERAEAKPLLAAEQNG